MAEKTRDLQERTAQFAEAVRVLVRSLPRTLSNIEDVKQLVRSSGSVAANCIEANEALGNKDRLMRFRICRKEAKESQLWLRLLNPGKSPGIIAEKKGPLAGSPRIEADFNGYNQETGMSFLAQWFDFLWPLAVWRLDFSV